MGFNWEPVVWLISESVIVVASTNVEASMDVEASIWPPM